MLRQKIKLNFFKNSKGGIGIVVLIVIIILGSTSLIGGIFPKTNRTTTSFEKGIPDMSSVLPGDKTSLQLKTLKFKKVPPPQGNVCKGNPFNEEPDIIYASDPAFGGVAQAGGQIRIWVWEDDGNGGSVAPGTKVDPTTGIITVPGNRAATDRNGYLWEPSVYITQLTSPDQPGPYSGDKENGGQPRFLTAIKGVANYGGASGDLQSVPIDQPVNIITNRTGRNLTFSEFIWDVNSLGLTSGYYRVQIILHDGDKDLAINCTTIQI